MTKLFKELKSALKEIIAHQEGKIELRTKVIEIPDKPPEYKAKDIKNIRERYNYSQGYFAKVLNVSPRTIQSWESGRRKPTQAALRLLEIIDKGIYNPLSKNI